MFRHADHFIHSHLHDTGDRELKRLYTSTSLYTLGLSLVSVFIPIYLYSLGFSISAIAFFYVVHYAFRLVAVFPIAKLVERLGVKHIMAASYLLTFLKVVLLITLPDIGWPLWFIAVVEGLDHSTYFLPYHIGVSKLKKRKAAGKQLSVIYQWNNLAGALGPILGGVIAQFFGVVYALIITAGVIVVSIIPLTRSPEPLREPQNMKLSRFPWKSIKGDIGNQIGSSVNQLGTQGIWTMFLGIYVFTQGNAYLGLGILSSVSFIFAIVIARYFGRLVDRGKGRPLLRVSALAQSAANLGRVFIASPPVAYVFNLIAEPIKIGSSLPCSHGAMARGDELSKNRILYMTVMEAINYVPKTLLWLGVFIIASLGHDKFGLQFVFLAGIPAAWLILSERFKSLNPTRQRAG
ncbi:MFS transporter [Candidatus Saccharibacteria bacterium]|nr:MFS transporter [Candidatus Saccharibacteria bacterium]